MSNAVQTDPLPETRAATASNLWRRHKQTVDGYLFLLPFLVVYLLFVIYPVLQAVWISFFKWDLLSVDSRNFIGFDNYVHMLWGDNITWDLQNQLGLRLAGLILLPLVWWAARQGLLYRVTAMWLSVSILVLFIGLLGIHPADNGRWNDSNFWTSLGNTFAFVLLSTPLIVIFGLLLAMVLNGKGRFRGTVRAVFFFPYVFSVSVVTLIWGFLLNPQGGILAVLFKAVGLEPLSWLTTPSLALLAIVITTLWWTLGFNMVLFLAGLQDIDGSLYEAASLDGASWWAKFRFITLPGLERTTLLVVILQVIASFQIFGQVYIMTRGGPGGTTRVLIQHIYETGFRDFDLGYASAMSIFLFIVMFVISVLQLSISPKEA